MAKSFRFLILLVCLLFSKCAHQQDLSVTKPAGPKAYLTVQCKPTDAIVLLDDTPIPPNRKVVTTAGFHRLQVQRDNFFSAYREFSIRAGKHFRAQIKLTPIPQ